MRNEHFFLFIPLSFFPIFEACGTIQGNIKIIFMLKEWKLLGSLLLSNSEILCLTDLSLTSRLAKWCALSGTMQESQQEASLVDVFYKN